MKISALPQDSLHLIEPLAAEWQPRFWSYADLQQFWQRGGITGLVTTDQNSDSSPAGVLFYSQPAPEVAELLYVYIGKSHRRRGLGRLILDTYHNQIASAGAEQAFLEVRHSNVGAIALYQSLGYRISRTRRNYYGGGEDGLDMIKEIGYLTSGS